MGKISKQKLATTNSFCVFGDSFFAHPSLDIPTKHNIKDTASNCNIWGSYYLTKGDGVGGN